MADLDKSLAIAVKTGNVVFGANSSLENAKTGKAKLIIIASNAPMNLKEDIETNCRISKIPFMIYNRTSIELGRICGKTFPLSALTIRDSGDSNILQIVGENHV